MQTTETRLNIRVDSEKLNKLKKLTGIKQNQELLNEALTLFEWAVKERKQKHIVGSFDEVNNKYKEVVMAALNTNDED